MIAIVTDNLQEFYNLDSKVETNTGCIWMKDVLTMRKHLHTGHLQGYVVGQWFDDRIAKLEILRLLNTIHVELLNIE